MSLHGDGTTRPSLPASTPQLRVRMPHPRAGILGTASLQARSTGRHGMPQGGLTKLGVREHVPAIRVQLQLSSSALPTHGSAERDSRLRDGLLRTRG